jgi:hypothetical protein
MGEPDAGNLHVRFDEEGGNPALTLLNSVVETFNSKPSVVFYVHLQVQSWVIYTCGGVCLWGNFNLGRGLGEKNKCIYSKMGVEKKRTV